MSKDFKYSKADSMKLAKQVSDISKPLRSAWKQELQASPNAIQFLVNLAHQQDPTPRAKWYESQSPDNIITQVRSMLASLSTQGSLMKEIADDDLKAESKLGPQGGHPSISELIPKLKEYWGIYEGTVNPSNPIGPQGRGADLGNDRGSSLQNRKPNLQLQAETFTSREWKQAKQRVIKRLKLHRRLRPMSYLNVVKTMQKDNKLTTNCGFVPGCSFRRRNNEEVIKRVLQLQSNDGWKQPAILGERSTRGKSRFIFMTSMATNVHGAAYSLVLQEHIRSLKLDTFSAWEGNQHTKRAVTRIMTGHSVYASRQSLGQESLTRGQDAQELNHTILSSDFTGMDQRFNRACMLEALDVIKEGFQSRYHADLSNIINYIADTPVIFALEDGSLRETDKEHSLISGSEWTNLIETLFDNIMWEFVHSQDYLCQGDDCAALSPWRLADTAPKFSELASQLGMTANTEKQGVSDRKAHYLQRYYYKEYMVEDAPGEFTLGGVYPLFLAVNSLMYPERFHSPSKWNKHMETIRNLMICENTCDHPLFKRFAEFVGRGDKYLKDFLQLSRKQLLKLESEARSIPGFIPSYNQESNSKRLYEFKTFKVWNAMKK